MRELVLRLERWIFDEESILISLGRFCLVFAIVLAPFIGAAIYSSNAARRACAEAGGVYSAVGTRTVYLWNAATKTTLPHTMTEYACLMPRP